MNFSSFVAHFFLELEMFQTKVVEKHEAQILYSLRLFRKSYRLWENNVEPGRRQMEIWRMRIACWVTKTTNSNTHVILIVFMLQQWLHEHASLLRYSALPVLAVLNVVLPKVNFGVWRLQNWNDDKRLCTYAFNFNDTAFVNWIVMASDVHYSVKPLIEVYVLILWPFPPYIFSELARW
jgi:hypothetical protein